MIQEAYERACVEGLFHADSYRPFVPGTAEYADYQVHLVQFSAYDGYHVFDYCGTRKEADRVAAEVNALGSVEAVDAYKKARMEARK
jgi:hypothetical protein